MLRDAREPSNELIETDVCIGGLGPVGISIARELRGRVIESAC